MKKLLPQLKNLLTKGSLSFSVALALIMLLGITNKSQAQVYYMTNDATSGTASTVDGINRMDYNGSNATLLANSFTVSPGIMELDLPNNRAFVYEAFSSNPPTGLAIKVVNLTTGAVTATINITETTARCYAIKYDAVNDYIYYILADSAPTTTSASDALIKVKPDGTGKTVVISGFSKNPNLLALDIANNKAYVYNQLAAEKNILTINLLTNTVSKTTAITAGASGGFLVNGMDYDDQTDYIYYLSSNNTGATNANDALNKIHPDGTGFSVIASVPQSPTLMALDIGNNRAFVFDNVAPARTITAFDLTTGASTLIKSLSDLSGSATVTGLWVPKPAKLTTSTASSVAATTAVLGGNITRTDVAVSERGIVYSTTNTLPTIGASGVTKVTNGTGSGSFTATVSGFTANNTYYARAYATSGAGTGYGAVTSFTTVKASQTITFAALATKTYGDADFAPGATASSGLGVSYASSNTAVATIVSGNVHIVGAGTTTITASQAGDASTNAATNATQTLTVNAMPITVTATAGQTKVYGNADPTFAYTVTSGTVKTGDNFTGALGRAAGNNVGSYAINQGSLVLSANYTITFVAANLTISKRNLEITPTTQTKVYGNAEPGSYTYTFTSGTSLASGDGMSGPFTRPAGENVGVYTFAIGAKHPVDISNGNDQTANYNITFVPATLTITKRPLSIAPLPVTKVYGQADFSTGAPYNLNGTSVAPTDGMTGSFGRANASENVGVYALTLGAKRPVNISTGNDASANYDITFTSNTFTITAKPITVTAAAQTKAYGDADPALTYTASTNLEFSDAFTGNLSRTTGEGIGTYAITQNTLALSSNYNLTYTGANLTIGKKTINITANAASVTYGDALPTFTYTSDPLVAGDSFTGELSVNDATAVGNYPITQGTLALNSSYIINFTSANLTISPRAINVYAIAQSSEFGDADKTIGYYNTGSLAPGDAITGTPSRQPGTAIGDYAVTKGTLVVSNPANYNLIFNSATYSITKRQIQVSAVFKTKIYGDADPTITYAIQSGTLLPGAEITGALVRAVGEDSGPYAVNQGTLAIADANYNLNYLGGSFEIDTAPLTIKADDKTKLVNAPNPTFTYTITGFKNGDDESALSGPVAFQNLPLSSAPAGTYAIDLVNISARNYNITPQSGVLTIREAATNANLASLSVAEGAISPTFDPATTTYSLSVGADITQVNITGVLADTNAKLLRISGLNATSGQANTVYVYPGDNQISVLVTAEDNSTTKEYIINVSKPLDTNSKLSGLYLSYNNNFTSVPDFDPEVHAYNVNVGNDVTGIRLTPFAAGASAFIKINGDPYEGFFSTGLTPGDNNFSIEVFAQDRTVSETYTLNIKRALSTNNNLSNLTIDHGTLNPVFNTNTQSYTASVPYSVSSLNINAAVADTSARVKVNGVNAPNFQAYNYVLAAGQNNITISVTAANGATKDYSLVVTRGMPAVNANYSAISLTPISTLVKTSLNNFITTVNASKTTITVTTIPQDANATVTVNGNAVANGVASGNITLNPTATTVTVVITAQDGVTSKTYTVVVNKMGASNPYLSGIALNPSSTLTTLSPDNYGASVNSNQSSVSVIATTQDTRATLTVNGVPATSGVASSPVTLVGGSTLIPVVITAEDGNTVKTYTITVTRSGSSNTTVNSIAISPASQLILTSANSYTTSVAAGQTSVSVVTSVQDANTTIKVNGTTTANGVASAPVTLTGPATDITVVITAQNGATKTYTITVNRAGSNNATLSNINLTPSLTLTLTSGNNYIASVNAGQSSITITPVAQNENATITVDGVAVANGTASGPITLQMGTTVINILVTAQDGVTTKTYAVTINKAGSSDARVNNIALTPATGLTQTSFNNYSATVINKQESVTVTANVVDAGATIKINGVSTASGTPSAPIALAVGSNVINVTATAEDGTTTKTYTITVTRIASGESRLSSINITPSSILTETSPYNFSTSVSMAQTSIVISALSVDPSATIKINGTAVNNGAQSGAINLNQGATLVAILVTAADGVSTRTYTINVARTGSSEARVSGITLTPSSILTQASPGNYTTTVSASQSTVRLTVNTVDANSTITVQGNVVTRGVPSNEIALLSASTEITVKVIAEDGTTTKTYKVTVNKPVPNNMFLVTKEGANMLANRSNNFSAFDKDNVVVHQGVSPNGDGFNDFLVVEGLSSVTGNKLAIMNASGTLVFDMKDYGKDGSRVFDGHAKSGKLLNAGTYYYVLDYKGTDGKDKRKSGYIILKY